MINFLKTLFLFFILIINKNIISVSFAQQDATKRPYLTIEDPKIKPLMNLHKRLIIKSAIKIVMKSQKYQLIFSSPRSFEDAKFEFHKLEMKGFIKKFGKNKKGYTLDFFLVDARTKEIIKQVKLPYVEKRHLVFKSKLLLYELFFGKEKTLELEEELKKETEREIQAELRLDGLDKQGLNNKHADLNSSNESLDGNEAAEGKIV